MSTQYNPSAGANASRHFAEAASRYFAEAFPPPSPMQEQERKHNERNTIRARKAREKRAAIREAKRLAKMREQVEKIEAKKRAKEEAKRLKVEMRKTETAQQKEQRREQRVRAATQASDLRH
ncbi:MAG: hypothetical protein M1838_002681 [Thelocarpon superellum]|nr:MAG: hypothetical protein M1838_002681 [Thelocarpon superellum]